MLKVKKIVIIMVASIIVLSIVLGQVAEKYDKKHLGPKQNFRFMNSSEYEATIDFYDSSVKNIDTTTTEPWYSFTIKPGKTKFGTIFQGNYTYVVRKAKDKSIVGKVTGFSLLEDTEEDNVNYMYIDTAGDKYIAIVNVNYIYGGNSFAEALSASMGTDMSVPYLAEIYPGNKPFLLPEIMYSRDTVINLGEELPKKISYAGLIYVVVPVSGKVENKKQALDEAVAFIERNF